MKVKLAKRICTIACAVAMVCTSIVPVAASNVTPDDVKPGVSDEQKPGEVEIKDAVEVNTADVKTAESLTAAVKSAVTNAKKDATVKVEVPKGVKTVQKDVFKEAKKAGVKLAIESSEGTKVTWVFGSITKEDVDFVPTVTVGGEAAKAVADKITEAKLPETTKYTPVKFDFEGTLPGAAEVTLDLTKDNKFKNGDKVYLYYYNPTSKLFELVDTADYKNGGATFKMTHCSDYIVSSAELPKNVVKQATTAATPDAKADQPAKTGDSNLVFVYSLLLLAGVAAVAAVILKKKKVF